MKADGKCDGVGSWQTWEEVSERQEWKVAEGGGGEMHGWPGRGSGWLRQSGGEGHDQVCMSSLIPRAGP